MKRMLWAMLLAVLGFTSPALARPPLATTDAALSRAEGESWPRTGSLDALDLSLEFNYRSVDLEWEIPSLDLRLGELPPETLMIEVPVSSWLTLFVLADLDAELPRLDAVDGDTYFAPGVEFHVTNAVSLYLEDFQPASGILGDEDLEVAPQRSWDGHQIAVGSRWQVSERVRVEGAAVIYTLSRTRRANGVGAQASLTLVF